MVGGESHVRASNRVRARGNRPTSNSHHWESFGPAQHDPSRSADDKSNAISVLDASDSWRGMARKIACPRWLWPPIDMLRWTEGFFQLPPNNFRAATGLVKLWPRLNCPPAPIY